MQEARILIADDEPINRMLLMHMLDEQGFTDCYEAENGQEAVELAKKIAPDLVLLELHMPEMDGFEVAIELKKEAAVHLPIIFITATEDKENLIKCLDVGGDDFATKPFDKAILAAKITAHLRSRQLALQIEEQNKELSAFRVETDQEYSMVEHIYSHALQNPPEVLKYFNVAVNPATTFNGDLFLVQPHPNGGLYFFLGDFTGHGLASTVGALPVSRTFTAMCSKGLSVVEIAQSLNELLYTFLPVDRFCAAAIGHINEKGTRATLWQGGMPDSLLQRQFGQTIQPVASNHMSLGILEPDDFETDCILLELEPGDKFTVFTDGLVEAERPKKESNNTSPWLGEEIVKKWLEANPNLTSKQIFDKADTAIEGAGFDDDVTIIQFTSTNLEGLKAEQIDISLPFLFSVTLGPEELRADNSIDQVFKIISNQDGLESIRADLFTVMTELYTNALEHGVLGLDSTVKDTPDGFMEYYETREKLLENLTEGYLRIDVNLLPKERKIQMAVSDSGEGFDYETLISDNNDASAGRGLMLLREIGESVRFEGKGNRTVVEMKI